MRLKLYENLKRNINEKFQKNKDTLHDIYIKDKKEVKEKLRRGKDVAKDEGNKDQIK